MIRARPSPRLRPGNRPGAFRAAHPAAAVFGPALWYIPAVVNWALVSILASVLASSGCGYQIVRYRDALGDARRVAIFGLENNSFEPGLESLVADAITREFLRRGALQVVSDPETADLIVKGSVGRVQTRSQSFSSIVFALEFRVTMYLDLQVERRDGSTIPIAVRALVESEIYQASADVEVTRTNRKEALRRLAGILAGRFHDSLFERITP
jgi:hypothetical protein